MPGAAPAFACVAPANSNAHSAQQAAWPAVRPAHAAGNALDSTVSPVNPARCIRNFIGLFRRCRYAAFDDGLGLGFLIGLIISIRHDMDHIAMADTTRNSGADRIKNSTDDSILKSYRGCPQMKACRPCGVRRVEMKGRLTGRCNRGTALRCWDPTRSGAKRRRKLSLSTSLLFSFLLLSFGG